MTSPSRWQHVIHWVALRRRKATGLMLRGACTGLGTAAVGLIAVWVQNRI